MSYDLMVFDPESSPKPREEFLEWYRMQIKWSEPHSYNDPAVTTRRLQAWFADMIKTFPAINGPFAPEVWPEDDESPTDYCIGNSVIYTAFAWSKAAQAYETMFRLAREHWVGFYDVSSENGEVWLPA